MVTRRTARRGGALLTAFALAALACNAALGIDEATLDPSLATSQSQAQPLNCDTYCSTIMQNCSGVNQEYLNADVCKVMCGHFELGIPNDQTEDSLTCRIWHANSAAVSPSVHCKHAGPTGGGHCGTQPCNAYCLLDVALCNGALSAYDGGETACRTECAKYTYITDPNTPDLIADGNTLNCRLYHLESAYDPSSPAAKTTHCPHTGRVSATCF
ncbi:MAG TPA: hypothetical protein VLT33_31320 [Labilithrix sp.]|nr:hypothetical protein [Labilithrix sp.]